jgi:PAS domain S-box-containing protein
MHQAGASYPTSFKAAVALAALRAGQSLDELAARYSLPVALIKEWAGTLEQQAHTVFSDSSANEGPESDFFDSTELAKIIAENSTQGLAMMDSNGYCIYANKAWLGMTGYTAQEIGSQPLHYLVHHHRPDGSLYPMEECPIDRALPENFDVRAHEDVFFRKDGSTFDVACAASPIFKAGKPAATIIEIRDVTEQKRQAGRQAESEQRAVEFARSTEEQTRRLNAFLDAAPVGIGMADATGRLILVNRANRELWGADMLHADNVDQYRAFKGWWADGGDHHGQAVKPGDWALARALRGADVDNDVVEIEPFDQPGVRKTVGLSARPIRNAEGKIQGAVVAQVDITLQKQAEEGLRLADRNKDEFIAILAHELRNPLAPIRAAIDLYALRGIDDPMLKHATEVMLRQVSHITRLVDDLLDVARISRRKVKLHLETCDIGNIVTETAEDYRPTIETHGVALTVHTPARPLMIEGDCARLSQVIGNILHNATKFTQPGNRIEITLCEESGGQQSNALIRVNDNGAGIEPELLKNLFSPFTQASQGLGRSSGGLGLGLALVKGLIELHGGSVSACSDGLGQGTTMTIRLPMSPRAASSAGLPPPPVVPQAAHLRVVAIDDNKDALEMLSLLLGLKGHEVMVAEDGASGLALVLATKPDAVICDIGLPGKLNGYDVARAIRAHAGVADIVVVALSGYGQESDKKRSLAAGFDAHLVKPVSYGDLTDMLQALTAQKAAR